MKYGSFIFQSSGKMPRFFIDMPVGDTAIITGADATHIGRSLRMRLGDKLIVCNNSIEYTTTITSISDIEVVCNVISSKPSLAEPNVNLTLYQALPKSDKMDIIVQKCVELGVSEIRPIISQRCVSRPDAKSFEKKKSRWQKIALEAAKQSGRGIIPQICDILTFEQCLAQMQKLDCALMCYEKGGESLSSKMLSGAKNIGMLIGCEGGFEQSEANRAAAASVTLIGLGKRILRCETAPIAAASIIMSLTGNM